MINTYSTASVPLPLVISLCIHPLVNALLLAVVLARWHFHNPARSPFSAAGAVKADSTARLPFAVKTSLFYQFNNAQRVSKQDIGIFLLIQSIPFVSFAVTVHYAVILVIDAGAWLTSELSRWLRKGEEAETTHGVLQD